MTQAEIFATFMKQIWEAGEDEYNVFNNAKEVAEALDAKPISRRPAPEFSKIPEYDKNVKWIEYLFPDDSTIEVLSDGTEIRTNPS